MELVESVESVERIHIWISRLRPYGKFVKIKFPDRSSTGIDPIYRENIFKITAHNLKLYGEF